MNFPRTTDPPSLLPPAQSWTTVLRWTALWSLIGGFAVLAEKHDGFLYQADEDGALVITGHERDHAHLTIPSVIEGRRVVRIANEAFASRSSLKSVSILPGIQSIGDLSFARCANLSSVAIGHGIERIGASAFLGTAFESISLPDSLVHIGESAFSECVHLERIVIPDNVQTIGHGAFFSCINLKKAVLGQNVGTIADSAFFHCMRLENVVLGQNVGRIENGAFALCKRLPRMDIPSAVTNIHVAAFHGSTNLAFLAVADDNPAYSSVDGVLFDKKRETLVIYPPGRKEPRYAIPVRTVRIGNHALAGHRSLRHVTIPASVTDVGRNAFLSPHLTEVTLDDGCVAIGPNWFGYASQLKKVNIPDSVRSIGRKAFRNTGLETVVIPASVTHIAPRAFYDCPNLAHIAVKEDNPAYSSVDGVLFDKNRETLLVVPAAKDVRRFAIPGSVTEIADEAFRNNAFLTALDVPASVARIGHDAFAGCTRLESVFFYGAMPMAGRSLFRGAGETTVYRVRQTSGWPESGEWWIGRPTAFWKPGAATTPLFAPDSGAYWGERLAVAIATDTPGATVRYTVNGKEPDETSPEAMPDQPVFVPIPGVLRAKAWKEGMPASEMRHARYHAASNPEEFIYSVGRDGVTLHQYLGPGAAVTIPSRIEDKPVVRIENPPPFDYDRSALEKVVVPDTVATLEAGAFVYFTNLTQIVLGRKLEQIGHAAFANCTRLKHIVIPDGVFSAGDHQTFANCENLESATLGHSLARIERYMFFNCARLETVTIRGRPSVIEKNAFMGCIRLDNVVLPDSVVRIAGSAFIGCRGLKTIALPDSLTEIGSAAFAYCTALENIRIPAQVAKLGGAAFQNCIQLRDIAIPSRVESIGNGAFRQCERLTAIRVADDNPAYSSVNGVLFDKEQTLLIHYPAGRKQRHYAVPDTVESIWPESFRGSAWLESVDIPHRVREIGNHAFLECDRLIAIRVADDNPAYSSVDGVLFDKEQRLLVRYPAGREDADYVIPASVEKIDWRAFSGCTRLRRVFIHAGIRDIGWSPFLRSVRLTDIVVEEDHPQLASVDGVLFNKDRTRLLHYPAGREQRHYAIPEGVTRVADYAFLGCVGLESVTVPASVTRLGAWTFQDCAGLKALRFQGTAPEAASSSMGPPYFEGTDRAVVYRRADAEGWPETDARWHDRPTALWDGREP